jgi:hypothetical protein
MDMLLGKGKADHLQMMAGKGGRRAAQRIVTLLSLGVKPLAFAVVNCLPLQQH